MAKLKSRYTKLTKKSKIKTLRNTWSQSYERTDGQTNLQTVHLLWCFLIFRSMFFILFSSLLIFNSFHAFFTYLYSVNLDWIDKKLFSFNPFRMGGGKEAPLSVVPSLQLAPKTFWLLVLTLLSHRCKFSKP